MLNKYILQKNLKKINTRILQLTLFKQAINYFKYIYFIFMTGRIM